MTNNYEKDLKNSIDVCPIWSIEATSKVSEMVDQIDQANSIINRVSVSQQHAGVKSGFAAETWHAESFNLDAILKDKSVRAFTDNFKGSHNLRKNDPIHDIIVMSGDERVLTAQAKYYSTPEKTANAFRERSKDTQSFKYEDNDIFLGPSDQLNDIKINAQKDIDTQQHRPVVAEGAAHVKNKAADKLSTGGAESKGLSKKDAEHLGVGNKTGQKLHKEMQEGYLNKATVQQSLKAAKNAAVITAVMAGTINCIDNIQKARNGEISSEKAVAAILKNTAIAAGDSALKAGAATASVSTVTRYMPHLFTGNLFQQSLVTGGIGGAAICVIDLVQCTVMFALGRMTGKELEERTGKNIFQTGSGVAGAAIGTSIGAIAGPPGMIIGSILGGMITSMATTIAIDNGIENSFKQSIQQTESMINLNNVVNDSLEYLLIAQDFYTEFQKGMVFSERHLQRQINDMQKQSVRLNDKLKNF